MKNVLVKKILLLMCMLTMMGMAKAQILENAFATDVTFRSVSIDPSGNKYYAGSFAGTIDFDPGAGVSNLTASDDGVNIFILKLDASGNFQWVRHIEPQPSGTSQTSTFQEIDLRAHSSGVLFVANTLRPYDLDPSAGTFITTSSLSTMSLVSLNSSGTFQFARNFESSTASRSVFVSGIERKSNRDIVIVGGFGGTVDFDPGAGVQNETAASTSNADPYILTLDENGDFVSVATFAGGAGNFTDIVLDNSDHAWVSGYQRGDMTVNGKNFPVIGTSSNFLIEFDASNSALAANQWAANGLSSFVTIDPNTQDVYVANRFTIAADFDPGATTNTLTPNGQDIAISKFNSSGSFQSVVQIGGSGTDVPYDIEVDDQSHLHLASVKPNGSLTEMLYQVYDSNFNLLRSEEPGFINAIYDIDIENFKMEWLGNFRFSTNNFDFCGGTTSLTDPGGAGYDPFRAVYTIEEFADVPTISASNTLVCGSESSTLSIIGGSLNGAANWQWYSGSCGGTPEGTGTSIMVSPTATTTYFVRGEGYTCNSAGDCASVTITVSDAPTDISISMNSVNENQSIGTSIGTFSSTDATPGDTHTYSFAAGTGDVDNASFSLVGNELQTAAIFDYETKDTYSIRIESEDALGCTFQKVFSITIGNVTPEAPTDITLSSSSINENNSINLTVGSFSTADDDTGETYTYSLVAGTGDTDNASFNINGNDLRASESFDFETKNSYSVRVQTNDGNSGVFTKQFTITVNNVLETGNDILTFSIPGQSGAATIDAVNHRVELDMGFGTDKSSLTPTITTSSGSSISPLSGTPRNFSNEVNYTVTAENGSNQIWTVKVYATIPAGTYTVGSGGDYATMVAAFTDFNSNGITGDITLEILNGHTEGLIGISGGWLGEDTYTVTTVPAAGATSITLERLSINGAKNLVFDGQNIINLSLNTAGTSIFSQNNSQNLVFKDLIIDNVSGAAVWFMDSDNIEVSGCSYSFGGSIPDQNIIVFRLNTASNVSYVGNRVFLGSEYNSSIRGITVFSSGSDTFIANNSVYASPTSAANLTVVQTTGMFYHNSIVVEGSGTIDDVRLVRNNSATPITAVNNSFYLDINHTVATGILSSNGSSTLTGNNFYMPDADGVNTNYLNIQGTTYGPADLAGIDAVAPGTTYSQPVFTNLSGGVLSLTGASLTDPDLRALPEALVTTDINGATRSSLAPTKGAFEHANTEASVLGVSFPEQQGDETINSGTFVIDAVAAANTDLTSLSPAITAFPGASVVPSSGSTQDFSSSGVVYNVTAETGGASQAWTLNITEFNAIPTDMTLSSSSIDENESIGTVVGTFSTSDANSSQSHTYTLVSGIGDTDNASFTINGNQLESAEVFDFETKFGYSILVRTDDGNGGAIEKQFTISVENVGENPTNILLSSSSIAENNSINDVVGTLSSVDDDNGEMYTYSLVPNGSLPVPDNASFNINGNELRASASFDFETKNSFLIRIRTNDNNGGVFTRSISITISDESEAPTDLSLDNTTIQENNAINSVIGNLSTADEDAGETYTYSLVAGTGDDDNGSFNINGSQLRASSSFDFETKDSYSVRIQTDDGNGGLYPKEFTISITNQVESPTDIGLSNNSISESLAIGTVVGTLSTTDEDNGETYTYTLVSGTGDSGNGSFQIVGDELRSNEIFDFETQTSYSIRIQTDDGNGNQYAEAFTINIGDVGPSITDIGLTNDQINENNSTPLTVGTFSTIGEEVTGTYTYSLVSGTGSTANSSFFISGDELRTSAVFDHEIVSSASIRIRTDDGMGSFFEKIFIVTVNDVNEAPTDIMLSANDIDENDAINENIGTLSSVDEDAGSTHTYSFVSGAGDTDNGSFNISGNSLRASESYDFETKSSYTVRIQTNDGNGGLYAEVFTIIINDVSEAPTALAITGASIDENNSINDVIGSFITTDEDAGETYTYSLVAGMFDDDNSSFNISGNQLRASNVFNFESQNSFLVRVRTDDGNGGSFERGFSIDVNDVNENPTALMLSNLSIDESNPVGTLVGTFSTTDEDGGQTHTYSLVSGAADADNASFTIVGNQLLSAEVFDFETQGLYSIRVRTDDGNGGTFESGFGLSINDIPASITSIDLSSQSIVENQSSGTLVGTFATSGEDLSGSFTYTLATGSGDDDNGSFTISGDQLLTAEAFNFETKSSLSVRVMTDDGSLTSEEIFTITVSDVSEAPTDIALSVASINENNSVGDVIGSFTTTDQDAGESYTYSLVSGAGDTDNSSFSISGSELRAAEVFDFEMQSSYAVRIQTSDGNGGTYEEAFTISIVNENESISVAAAIADQSFTEGFATSDIDLSGVFSDEDGDALNYSVSSSNTGVVTVGVVGTTLTITEVGIGTSTITITADDGSGSTTSDIFDVTVTEGNNAPIVANSFPDEFSAPEGFGANQISYAGVFSDADGDNLTITTVSSDESVVTVELIANEQIQVNEVGLGVSTITVTANDGNGGTVSDTFTFTVTEAPLALEDAVILEIYPNPATDFVNIKSDQHVEIGLFDLRGQRIQSAQGHSVQMDLQKLSSGSYLLKIADGESTVTRRIIKAN